MRYFSRFQNDSRVLRKIYRLFFHYVGIIDFSEWKSNDESGGWRAGQIVMFLLSLLVLVICLILLTIFLTVRRNKTKNSPPTLNSNGITQRLNNSATATITKQLKLPINSSKSDDNYTVSYQLKSGAACCNNNNNNSNGGKQQPDIISRGILFIYLFCIGLFAVFLFYK